MKAAVSQGVRASRSLLVVALLITSLPAAPVFGAEAGDSKASARLIGHWPLAGNSQEISGSGLHAQVRGAVDFNAAGPGDKPRSAAAFNGRDAFLEVPIAPALRLGTADFSLSAWIESPERTTDVPGDVLSLYDSSRKRGIQLTLKSSAGVASAQPNYRQLQFGIDNNQESPWTDCGRPGQALLAFALAAYDGQLYAGTCESGEGQSGRVYRYGGGQKWIDCGAPTQANAVTALAELDGRLYAATGKYRLGGSALEESKNTHLGGRVLRYEGDQKWTDCGQLPGVEAVGGLAVYNGSLYASSLYKPAGFFRYDGDAKWTDCGAPGRRVEALGVYKGYLYATSYDGGVVFRYDGRVWQDCGQLGSPEENTQTYSLAVYGGRLYVGTWRTGRVYRFEDLNRWTDVGRLGQELEVMGMLVHNGRLIAGTLPLAEVYDFQEDATWRRLAQLDQTPEVTYRRAWTLAEFGGGAFCSTLPSGHVYAYQAGRAASSDRAFPGGWHHVTAVKRGGKLNLYVDGLSVAESANFDPAQYDLSVDAPLRVGLGTSDYFHGRISQVRLHAGALSAAEIAELAKQP